MTFFERRGRCCLLLTILSLCYFSPLWLHPTEVLVSDQSDLLDLYYPWRYYAVAHLQSTHSLPLWFTPGCCGEPFQADAQTQLFYPPYFLFYLLPLSWVAPLFGFFLWAHVLLAGLAMYGYARWRGLVPFAALVAAVGFMFAGKWLLHVLLAGHHVFLPLAWFPLLLLGAERAIVWRRLSSAIGAGLVAAVIFTGCHPQLTLYIGFLAALLSLRPVFSPEDSLGAAAGKVSGRGDTWLGRLRWWFLTWTVVGLVAAALAAVHLLPVLELMPHTLRARAVTPDFGELADLTFRTAGELGQRLLSLQGPQHFGGNAWESVGAFGVLWAGLAVLALVLCRRPGVWWNGAALLLLALFAANSSTPVYPLLRRVVPGFALFRIPTRMLLLAGFPLGMLAGCLTQRLFAARPPGRSALLLGAGILAALVALFLTGSLLLHTPHHSYNTLVAVLGLALVGVVAVAAWRPSRSAWAAAFWLALLTADLWALHGRFLRTRPVDDVFPATDAVRFLAEHPGDYRILDRFIPGQTRAFISVTHPLSCLHNLEKVYGDNVSELFAYRRFLNYISDRKEPPGLGDLPFIPSVRNQQLLDLLGVRYLFSPAEEPLPPAEARCWRRVGTLTDNPVFVGGRLWHQAPLAVFERKSALPRTFVVARARPTPAPDELLRVLRDTDLTRTVLLDRPPAWFERGGKPDCGSFAGPRFQEATVVVREPNRIVIQVDRKEPGYLVLLDAWYPGWRCRLEDGRELPVWRANSFFRSVQLPPGRHRVEFVFAPPAYALGKTISLAALLTLLGWLAWRCRCRLRNRTLKPTAPEEVLSPARAA